MTDSEGQVAEWLRTQPCPHPQCPAVGDFKLGNVRYTAPLLFEATCNHCGVSKDCYGPGIAMRDFAEDGTVTETRSPPQWA